MSCDIGDFTPQALRVRVLTTVRSMSGGSQKHPASGGSCGSLMSGKDLFLKYVAAYNLIDVDAMLAFFDDACVFENISGGKVTVRTAGKAELAALARRSAAAFASREQEILSLIEGPGKVVAEIDYHAVLQADLSPEMKAGSRLQLRGVSVCEIAGDRIIRLSDYS